MLEALTELIQAVWQQPIQVAIELLLIAAVIWVLLGYLLRTRAAAVVIPISIFVLLLVVILDLLSSASDAFARLRAVVDWVIGGSLIALLFAFQPELRQGLMKLDPSRWFGSAGPSGTALAIEAVIQASKQASPIRQGMIVAFERKASLEPLVESGIRIDACVSTPLLMSIFHKESPLHDLGIVVRHDRIVAAKVQFPLAEEGSSDQALGSRHRAALGLSEETDAVVLVVSEETGHLSLAVDGELSSNVKIDQLRAKLRDLLSEVDSE